MTARTVIVIVQAGNGVKKEQPSKICKLIVYSMSNPLFECVLNPAREAMFAQHRCQLLVQHGTVFSGALRDVHERVPDSREQKYPKSYCPSIHRDPLLHAGSKRARALRIDRKAVVFAYGTRGLRNSKIPLGCSTKSMPSIPIIRILLCPPSIHPNRR